ncbi:MAG: SdpI family protein [Reichenbachiella sp.]
MDTSIFAHLAFGPTMLVMSILFKTFPPKKINNLYGYRTSRSMKNRETWDYSNKLWSTLFIYASLLTIIAQIIIYFTISETFIYEAIAQVVLVLATIPITEIQIKKRFDEDGIRR